MDNIYRIGIDNKEYLRLSTEIDNVISYNGEQSKDIIDRKEEKMILP